MAENQHADTANYDNQIPVDEQLSDILLVFDKEEKQLKAVKGIDEKGELKMAPADSKSLDYFMKVDKVICCLISLAILCAKPRTLLVFLSLKYR